MKFLPRFSYGAGPTLWTATVAMRLWTPSEGPRMGDEDRSGASIPVAYYVGWEHAVKLSIRFTDAERVAFMTMMEYLVKNKSTPFTFRFDVADAATEYSFYLEEPTVKDRVEPVRLNNTPWWEYTIVARSVNGTRIHVALPLT